MSSLIVTTVKECSHIREEIDDEKDVVNDCEDILGSFNAGYQSPDPYYSIYNGANKREA